MCRGGGRLPPKYSIHNRPKGLITVKFESSATKGPFIIILKWKINTASIHHEVYWVLRTKVLTLFENYLYRINWPMPFN